MKLYENIAYEKKGKKYSKFSMTIPKKAIKALKWRKGDDLTVEMKKEVLVVRRLGFKLKTKKKPEMGA